MPSRIAVIDDEPHMRDLLAKLFSDTDVEVQPFARARDAVEYICGHEADVVISDIMMPGIKGDSCCHEIKKIDPTIQLVIITGYPDEKLISECIRIGISDIFIKPFDFTQVKEVALSAVSRSRNLKTISAAWRKPKE